MALYMSKTLTFTKYAKLPLLWPRILSLWPMVEKLLLCQLFFCCFLKMKKMDLRPFCFKAIMCVLKAFRAVCNKKINIQEI